MNVLIILTAILLMSLFIIFCLTLFNNDDDIEYCKLIQESCQYPILNNCHDCPIYKENSIK